tara:strand:+ start:1079 stop:1210 length:132 start_codon:yes stop_codon:yes gene_type:complete
MICFFPFFGKYSNNCAGVALPRASQAITKKDRCEVFLPQIATD